MQELIKVATNAEGNQVVSARELHLFLGNTDNVNTWFKRQCERAMLSDEDFESLAILQPSGQTSTDYAISLQSAKEIAMLNGGEKGKQARLYFIECEKQLKDNLKPLSLGEIILQQATLLVNQEREIKAIAKSQELIEDRIKEVEAKQTTKDENFYTISGYASLHNLRVGTEEAKNLGKQASLLSKASFYPTGKAYDSKYGRINTYHKDILKLTFKN